MSGLALARNVKMDLDETVRRHEPRPPAARPQPFAALPTVLQRHSKLSYVAETFAYQAFSKCRMSAG